MRGRVEAGQTTRFRAWDRVGSGLDALAKVYCAYSKISNVGESVVVEVSFKPVVGFSNLSPEVDSYQRKIDNVYTAISVDIALGDK